jgi:hypothetical protein
MLAKRSTVKFLGEQRLELSRLVAAPNSAASDATSFESFMVLSELDTREFAILGALAGYPTRAASLSANLGLCSAAG